MLYVITLFCINFYTNCVTHSQPELIDAVGNQSDTQELIIDVDTSIIRQRLLEKTRKVNRRFYMRRVVQPHERNMRIIQAAQDGILISEQRSKLQKGRRHVQEHMARAGLMTRVALNAVTSLLCYNHMLVSHELLQQYPQDTEYFRQLAAIECFVNNSAEEPVDFELGMVPIIGAGAYMRAELDLDIIDNDEDEELFRIETKKDIIMTPPRVDPLTCPKEDIPFYPFFEVLTKSDKHYQIGKTYTTRKYTIPPQVTDYTIAFFIAELPGVGFVRSLYPAIVQEKLANPSYCMQINKDSIQLNFTFPKNKLCYPKEETKIKTEQAINCEILLLTKMPGQKEFQILSDSVRFGANGRSFWSPHWEGHNNITFTKPASTNLYYSSPLLARPYTLADLKAMPRGISQRIACFLEPIRSGTGVSLQDGQCVKAHPEDDLLRLHTNITLNLSKVLDDLSSITGTDNESTEIFD